MVSGKAVNIVQYSDKVMLKYLNICLYKELLRRTTCDFELVRRHYAPSNRIEDELRHPAIDRLEHHLHEKMN